MYGTLGVSMDYRRKYASETALESASGREINTSHTCKIVGWHLYQAHKDGRVWLSKYERVPKGHGKTTERESTRQEHETNKQLTDMIRT